MTELLLKKKHFDDGLFLKNSFLIKLKLRLAVEAVLLFLAIPGFDGLIGDVVVVAVAEDVLEILSKFV